MIVRGTGRPTVYKNAKGERLPSVTTITGARKAGIEGLLVWANRLGQDGKDHREVRDSAAEAGTLAHAMVENSIHGRDPMEGVPDNLSPEVVVQAKNGFSAFEQWSRVMKVDYVATETPIVSELYQFGGTPDAIAKIDGRMMLLDWKTSNGIYGDYLIQLAAYRWLWEENTEGQDIAYCFLLRFGKEHGDFHVHSFPLHVLDMGWKAFKLLRELYDLDKAIGKVCK